MCIYMQNLVFGVRGYEMREIVRNMDIDIGKDNFVCMCVYSGIYSRGEAGKSAICEISMLGLMEFGYFSYFRDYDYFFEPWSCQIYT